MAPHVVSPLPIKSIQRHSALSRLIIKLLGGTLIFQSIAVGAQEAGRTTRLGFLVPNPRQLPAVHALFDELRLNGFVEGQNLFVIPNGFEALGDNVDELARALIDAKPDVVIAGRCRSLG